MSGVAAIVPAAGVGSRVGGRRNKLFLPLAGEPLLSHTLRTLQASAAVQWIAMAIRPEDQAQVDTLLRRCRITKALPSVPGGASRAESVASAFGGLPAGAKWVLIHDGARPCLTPALVSRLVSAAKRHGAVACGLPASLTVKAADEDRWVRVTLDRERLWFVQTPQVFRWDWFSEALARAGLTKSVYQHDVRSRLKVGGSRGPLASNREPRTLNRAPRGLFDRRSKGRHWLNGHAARALERFSDDAALVEAAGFAVRMVQGDPLNIKVTTKEDFLLAEAVLQSRATRHVKTQKAKVSFERPVLERQF